MIILNPNWVLERLGMRADPELVELLAVFMMRLREAKNGPEFLKDALRKALVK
jgi:hypothetical protein